MRFRYIVAMSIVMLSSQLYPKAHARRFHAAAPGCQLCNLDHGCQRQSVHRACHSIPHRIDDACTANRSCRHCARGTGTVQRPCRGKDPILASPKASHPVRKHFDETFPAPMIGRRRETTRVLRHPLGASPTPGSRRHRGSGRLSVSSLSAGAAGRSASKTELPWRRGSGTIRNSPTNRRSATPRPFAPASCMAERS